MYIMCVMCVSIATLGSIRPRSVRKGRHLQCCTTSLEHLASTAFAMVLFWHPFPSKANARVGNIGWAFGTGALSINTHEDFSPVSPTEDLAL